MSQVRAIHPPRNVSRPPSVFSAASIDTLVTPDNGYRGFPSREAYLQALREWVEEKMYYEPGETGLHGFYGTKTVDDILHNQGAKIPKGRRATVAPLGTLKEDEPLTTTAYKSASSATDGHQQQHARQASESGKSGGNKLKRVFSRRKSTA